MWRTFGKPVSIEHLMRALPLNLGADSLRAANSSLASQGYDVAKLRLGSRSGAGTVARGVPGELLFRVTTAYVILLRPYARLMRPYIHPLHVADFKGIRAG